MPTFFSQKAHPHIGPPRSVGPLVHPTLAVCNIPIPRERASLAILCRWVDLYQSLTTRLDG